MSVRKCVYWPHPEISEPSAIVVTETAKMGTSKAGGRYPEKHYRGAMIGFLQTYFYYKRSAIFERQYQHTEERTENTAR